ncbi:NADH-quinone oxidoreductase subunit G [Dyadobacter jejuensis]|uniref:NADH-quinone oxidoreductase subunit G n=1 Tax=Dyadobacter jejuensis TaxID=1082580 RepID=A0A316AR56_9BACT|nr:NADH-quinone oxidoreductase subunit NuoG [Dyadobacter jejuensis]PWJ60092.1 NADH-quinone oxidoreductase subunit G [Dyadobacter jejuensis]
MAQIHIDKESYDVKNGKNLLETCLSLGYQLPYFCWHPALNSVGACRQCAIKVFKDEKDTRGRIVMACVEPVSDGLHLSVADPEASAFRSQNIEWLMTNHPHDCAVCDEGGSCHLQDMTVMTGHAYRRFQYPKRTHHNQYLGPLVHHEMNRCIQCYRCVRFYKDYAGGKDLDVFAAHDHVYFGRAKEGILESEFSGNLAEVCPTGVFTDKTLHTHYTRKWDLTMAPSVCQHCSLGCNIIAGERYGSLRSITNRYHEAVNGYFLCDRGRYGYEFVNHPSRIQHPNVRGRQVSGKELYTTLQDLLTSKNWIGVGSPRASLEANFALRKLVGDQNFYQGVSKVEADLLQRILHMTHSGQIHQPSLQEIEQADLVLILGEDPTHSAPRMALSIRQAVRNIPLQQTASTHIPAWHDVAQREYIQDTKGPLYIAYPVASKLDELASYTLHDHPDVLAAFGFDLAQAIGDDPLGDQNEPTLLRNIAEALLKAERPLIVTGTSLISHNILEAAWAIAMALKHQNKNASLSFILPSCNSAGLAYMEAEPLEVLMKSAKQNGISGAIVLENDLYRHYDALELDQFFESLEDIIVLDHLEQPTTAQATVTLPAATFAETSGTLVNNEGRVQSFYQVYMPKNEDIRPSWQWLTELYQIKIGLTPDLLYPSTPLLEELAASLPQFAGIGAHAPTFGLNGQKIPREPHRYSGRTAMLAHIAVSEPRPDQDELSPFSFTMEGSRGFPPPPLTPYYWSPGWNSNQALNKYQIEVGGALAGRHAEVNLFAMASTIPYPTKKGGVNQSQSVIQNATTHTFELLPITHIFGSEELSGYGDAISKLAPAPYFAINKQEASRLSLQPGVDIHLRIGKQTYPLTVQIGQELPAGCAAIPYNIPPLTGITWPAQGTLIPTTP